jgi:hypothetical protein
LNAISGTSSSNGSLDLPRTDATKSASLDFGNLIAAGPQASPSAGAPPRAATSSGSPPAGNLVGGSDALGQVNGVSAVQMANNIGEILKPDAIVIGETHGPALAGDALKGGNFALFSTKDGSATYFGAKPLRALPDIPTPFGPAKGGVALVGTRNQGGDEGGVGVSYKFPTPAGDVLLFVNGRQDAATAGGLAEALAGKPGDGQTKVSVNIGAAYSASDGALIAASGSLPGAVAIKAGADLANIDGWIGVGYRGVATFEEGQLKSVNISGVEIPIGDLGAKLGEQAQAQRQKPTLIPNRGSSQIASLNDTLLAVYGQSPWDIAHSAKKKTENGATQVLNGTVDVLNHGNSVVAVAEPIYELGVKYGELGVGERIGSNAEAGQIVQNILKKAAAESPTAYFEALSRLNNKYDLNFGSLELQTIQQAYPQPRPQDYEYVRDVFEGQYRNSGDMSP